MSAFKRYPRTWCADCGKRILGNPNGDVCWGCRMRAQEQDERDAENRSWIGFSADERARFG